MDDWRFTLFTVFTGRISKNKICGLAVLLDSVDFHGEITPHVHHVWGYLQSDTQYRYRTVPYRTVGQKSA